jgi:hypothetical protein
MVSRITVLTAPSFYKYTHNPCKWTLQNSFYSTYFSICVWIGELLLKLERYGIKGDFFIWLKSYLTNRSQKVAIKEALSELDDLKAGVPQGSVLVLCYF